jgi:hypothetical protein
MLAWWVVYGLYGALGLSHWVTQAPQQMFARGDTKVVGIHLEASLATSQAGGWVLIHPPPLPKLPSPEGAGEKAGRRQWQALAGGRGL